MRSYLLLFICALIFSTLSFAQDKFFRSDTISIPATQVSEWGNFVAGVDLDKDGQPEIYCVNSNAVDSPDELIPKLIKYEYQNKKWVQVWSTVLEDIPGQNTWPALTVGDLDKDGREEIIWGPPNYIQAQNTNPERIVVFEARADGSDALGVDYSGTSIPNAKWTITTNTSQDIRPMIWFVSDIDNDGKNELIYADRSSASGQTTSFGVISVSNIPDNADGSETWRLEASGKDARMSSIDGTKAKYDIVQLNNMLYLFEGTGFVYPIKFSNGIWTALNPQTYPGISIWKSAQVVDINKDGVKEIVYGSMIDGNVYLGRQQGDTLLFSQIGSFAKLGVTKLNGGASGDIDGDGKLDFIFGSRTGSSIPVNAVCRLKYTGGDITDYNSYKASIIDSLIHPTTGQIDAIKIADVDKDGKQEVIYTSGYCRGAVDYPRIPIVILKIQANAAGNISVISPNGGESWKVGESRSITWTSSGVTNVRIDYSTNNGISWVNITPGIPASPGSYSWKVEDIPGMNCKLRVTDANNEAVSDESDNVFTINSLAAQSISVTSPNGGETWTAGEKRDITWTSTGITNIKIEYSTDNGANWSTIISSNPASTGSYSWIVLNSPSTSCRVRISDTAGPNIKDESDNNFIITSPPVRSVSLISPNGGETWRVGAVNNINWTSSGVANVRIDYSTNNGTDWLNITTSSPASAGTFNWTVANTPSVNCKLKISDAANSAVSDMSDNVFAISHVKTIIVTRPAGSEIWRAGNNQSISWTSTGGITSVKLEYSSDNGSSWNLIRDGNPNSESYDWPVPAITSSSCKIRVSDVTDASVSGTSNSVFSIFQYPSGFTLSMSKSFQNAEDQSSYKLIGLPGQVNISLSSIMMGARKTDWNAYWDNGASTEYKKEFDETGAFTFKPGNAFWIISRNPVSVNQQVNSVTLSSDMTYTIQLHNGWNLISNPFEISIAWNAIKELNPDITQPVWSFNGGYSSASTLDPYQGYYFYNITNMAGIKVPYKASSNLHKQSSGDNKIRISLNISKGMSDAVELKYDERSLDGTDIFDVYSPGADFTEASVNIVHKEAEPRSMYLKTDIRPSLKDGQKYILEMNNHSGKSVRLKVDENTICTGIYLIDCELNRMYDLSQDVNIPAAIVKKTFWLIAGKEEYAETLLRENLPKEFKLYQNYPNPFNPSTVIRYALPGESRVDISVYNALGERVRVLVNNIQPAGYYEETFHAENLSTGIYYYEITVQSTGSKEIFRSARKMLLVK